MKIYKYGNKLIVIEDDGSAVICHELSVAITDGGMAGIVGEFGGFKVYKSTKQKKAIFGKPKKGVRCCKRCGKPGHRRDGCPADPDREGMVKSANSPKNFKCDNGHAFTMRTDDLIVKCPRPNCGASAEADV